MTARVLIAVTHLLGAGHLTRVAALGRALANRGADVTLVSGGMPAPLVSAAGLRAVQLPPVRVEGVAFRSLLDEEGRVAGPALFAERRRRLLDCLAASRPDILVTELYPFGRRVLAEEFAALVDAARVLSPHAVVAASIRDILVTPARPERIAQTHARLLADYDLVLVHGDASFVPLDASWPLVPEVAALVRETGYIDEGELVAPAPARRGIVVSGGSSAASLRLLEAAVAAAPALPEEPWRILAGGGLPAADLARFAAAAPAHVVVERARPDFRRLLAAAAVSVSQAGYNTAVDLWRTGPRAVLVPFEAGNESEQRLRAERFAASGRASVLSEDDLAPDALAAAVRKSLAGPLPTGAVPDLDGAARSAGCLLDALAARRPAPAPGVSRPRPDFAPLREALRRSAGAGRTPALWWRDDDADADRPALRRLLALSRDSGCPVAVAAVPRRTDAGLGPLLAEHNVPALVHGLSHLNHAPAGEKKAEFGPHRSLATLCADAAAALTEARRRVGAVLLPVFVPPWNRLAPELAGRLAGLGYRGLSAWGGGPAPTGLVRIDTDIDPVDWHGGRELLDPDTLIARAAATLVGGGDSRPLGLLTHHLVHSDAIWAFCGAFLQEWQGASGRFLLAKDLFCVGQPDPRGDLGVSV